MQGEALWMNWSQLGDMCYLWGLVTSKHHIVSRGNQCSEISALYLEASAHPYTSWSHLWMMHDEHLRLFNTLFLILCDGDLAVCFSSVSLVASQFYKAPSLTPVNTGVKFHLTSAHYLWCVTHYKAPCNLCPQWLSSVILCCHLVSLCGCALPLDLADLPIYSWSKQLNIYVAFTDYSCILNVDKET